MRKITLCDNEIRKFAAHLRSEERSPATVSKYLHDVRKLALYAGGRAVDKALTLGYKAYLGDRYAVSSANSMLAAVNTFFKFFGRYDLTVKQFKVQRSVCRPEEKELTVRIPEGAPAYDYVIALSGYSFTNDNSNAIMRSVGRQAAFVVRRRGFP